MRRDGAGHLEPVADYLLQAMGFNILTPFTLEKAIMDGNDPSPQDVTTQNRALRALWLVFGLQALINMGVNVAR